METLQSWDKHLDFFYVMEDVVKESCSIAAKEGIKFWFTAFCLEVSSSEPREEMIQSISKSQ